MVIFTCLGITALTIKTLSVCFFTFQTFMCMEKIKMMSVSHFYMSREIPHWTFKRLSLCFFIFRMSICMEKLKMISVYSLLKHLSSNNSEARLAQNFKDWSNIIDSRKRHENIKETLLADTFIAWIHQFSRTNCIYWITQDRNVQKVWNLLL